MTKPISKLIYSLRDLRSRKMFTVISEHCRGEVLDVGGGDFFLKAKKLFVFSCWTSLEPSRKYALSIKDPKYSLVIGDGQAMKFKSGSFDTVLCIQVLEHVFEPNKMISEIARVLKKDGKAILLIPQTATTHMAPDFYYNFSRYWIQKVSKKHRLKIIELNPIGGFWSTIASRQFYFLLQSLRYRGMTDKTIKRNWLFYLLVVLQWLYVFITLPIVLLFSLGDLTEEPNNHLVVLRK